MFDKAVDVAQAINLLWRTFLNVTNVSVKFRTRTKSDLKKYKYLVASRGSSYNCLFNSQWFFFWSVSHLENSWV